MCFLKKGLMNPVVDAGMRTCLVDLRWSIFAPRLSHDLGGLVVM
jgi:hypothetical protein